MHGIHHYYYNVPGTGLSVKDIKVEKTETSQDFSVQGIHGSWPSVHLC